MSYGADLPTVECIVLARPTRSVVMFLQMVGRGMCPAPGKSHFLLVDHGRVAAVESELPPTITALAQMGTQSRADTPVVDLGELRAFARFCSATSQASFAAIVPPDRARELVAIVGEIDSWLDQFMAALLIGIAHE